MKIKEVNKRAQLSLFIILGIFAVGAVVLIFAFKDRIFQSEIPSDMQPVYTSFLSCLEEKTLIGINVLESQGGYIELPEFESGSRYMPFGSQLNFLGNPIPYWYYVSGNNLPKEQVPSAKNMESEIGDFVEEKIRDCRFASYHEQGFEIISGVPKTDVNIREESVEVLLDMDFSISRANESVIVRIHSTEVKSKLGKLYSDARKIYDKEQKDLFLEDYAVDNLRLYAPVDGVELTCSPLTWSVDEIFDNLQSAIEANTLSLKVSGGDYSLANQEDKYFIIDSDVTSDVRFLNSASWANSFEVSPSEENVLISKPVGNQPGLGILGFCYVPYHFVYNVRYPVLVQLYEGDEIFQFPLAVVIEGNKPRKALDSEASLIEDTGLCENKNTLIKVKTYDSKLNSVEANISYECLDSVCDIGKTTSGELNSYFPQCINGYIVAKSEGFKERKQLYSTAEEGNTEILLDKLYNLNVELNLDEKSYSDEAIINFVSGDFSKTIVYPEQKNVELSEGQYEVSVYIYKNSSIKLAETTKQQCIETSSGIGGMLGFTKEKCFDIQIPEQIISNALSGGGKENYYILESELANSKTIQINADSLPAPRSIEQLQDNYLLFESKDLNIILK